MDYIWEVPDKGFVKINVHCISTTDPLLNGNSNDVGVIVRNNGGRDLWTALVKVNQGCLIIYQYN